MVFTVPKDTYWFIQNVFSEIPHPIVPVPWRIADRRWSKYIHIEMWDVIIYPCPNPNDSWIKSLLELEKRYVIISRMKPPLLLSIHPIS